MYEVIGGTKSRAFRVYWMLEELGVDYVGIPMKPRSAELIKINPSGKVPLLVDDGTIISDSMAILTYLGDKHKSLTYEAGTKERAIQDGFTFSINDEIDGILWMAARHSFILPEEMRIPNINASLKWEFTRNCKNLVNKMSGPFLMGEKFTIPDILLTTLLRWAKNIRFDHNEKKLDDYLILMKNRDAFKNVKPV
jgi:glutathione S-transferase